MNEQQILTLTSVSEEAEQQRNSPAAGELLFCCEIMSQQMCNWDFSLLENALSPFEQKVKSCTRGNGTRLQQIYRLEEIIDLTLLLS